MKQFNNEEIIKLIQNGKITIADIVDSGICPTCKKIARDRREGLIFKDFENIKYNRLRNFQNSNIKISKILVLEFFYEKIK